MVDTFFQGDTVELFSDTGFDGLEAATLIEIIVTKPSGEVAKWTATQVDPTDEKYDDEAYADLTLTDSFITYLTVNDTDLDELGTYKMQAHITWGVAGELHGSIQKFKVKAHLAEV